MNALDFSVAGLIYFCMVGIAVFWLEDNWPEASETSQAIAGLLWPLGAAMILVMLTCLGMVAFTVTIADVFVKGRNKFLYWITGTEQN